MHISKKFASSPAYGADPPSADEWSALWQRRQGSLSSRRPRGLRMMALVGAVVTLCGGCGADVGNYADENKAILDSVSTFPSAEPGAADTEPTHTDSGKVVGWTTRQTYSVATDVPPAAILRFYERRLVGWTVRDRCCAGEPDSLTLTRKGAQLNITADSVVDGSYDVSVDAHESRTTVSAGE